MVNCKRWLALLTAVLLLAGLLCGCGEEKPDSPDYKENAGQTPEDISMVSGVDKTAQFTDRDNETSYGADAVKVTLRDNGSTAGTGVSVKGNVITIQKAGTYVLSGSLSNGRVLIDAGETDKVQLVLDGVSITCAAYGALYVRQADKVFITLAEGSENTLTSTAASTEGVEDNIDGVFYAKDDVTFNGSGKLTVTGPNHGIVVKASLVVTGGTYTITAQGGHAVQAKKDIRISDGVFTLTAEKDGIHAENADDTADGYVYIAGGTYTVTADGDGFSAATLVQVSGGSGTLTCGGGAANGEIHTESFGGGKGGRDWMDYGNEDTATEDTSAKGMKGGTGLLLEAGTWTMDTADDGLHSNADLSVSGGTLTISTGDDGIHADGVTVIQDGTITITKSYEGIEGNAIEIVGGVMNVTASDDGLNAAGGNDQSGFGGMRPDQFSETGSNSYIRISGGKLTVDASGDGIDANHTLYIEGGETYVSGPTNGGNGALDYGVAAQVTGGIFVAVGAQGMAQGFTSAEGQGAALLNVGGNASGELVVKDSDGKILLQWTPAKSYASVALTCPGLTKGESYTITVAGNSQTFELTDWLYGSSGGMGGPGGMGGGMGGPGGMGKPGRW